MCWMRYGDWKVVVVFGECVLMIDWFGWWNRKNCCVGFFSEKGNFLLIIDGRVR